jgi:hypothetical protein
VANTPDIILGEANLKAWVNSVDPNNMLNRQVRGGGGRTYHIIYIKHKYICGKFKFVVNRYRTVCLFYFGEERTHKRLYYKDDIIMGKAGMKNEFQCV